MSGDNREKFWFYVRAISFVMFAAMIMLLLNGCVEVQAPDVPVPGGEALYCAEHPDAPYCRNL